MVQTWKSRKRLEKKIFIFLFAVCVIIPSIFVFGACKKKESPEPQTNTFAVKFYDYDGTLIKDNSEYEIDVDPMVSHIEVIKLIVQPLVENAIYHGIKYKEDGKGTIRVESAYAGDKLEIKVIDNGIGMTKEALEHIFDERVTDRHKNGVGVLNVHRRIQLHYGMAYGLSFESEVGVGTTVTITLPLEREDIEGRTML